MKRPQLVHFSAVCNSSYLSIRAALSFKTNSKLPSLAKNLKTPLEASRPIDNLSLLGSKTFRLKIICLAANDQTLITREYDSDNFGDFNIRLPWDNSIERISRVKIFEIQTHPGIEINMGVFIPTAIPEPSKILITDFDKTLVDTKYSTMKEMLDSLRNSLDHFPSVERSKSLIKNFIDKDYIPFVVSASPHFYEAPIRDWLYQNQIFCSNIFLKDYRKVFSFFEDELNPKDIKTQGFYKLNHIVNILLMTGIPHQLALIGDGFESDAIIYSTIKALLTSARDPWSIWNKLKEQESFRLSNTQHFRFLSKFYQLKNMADDLDHKCQVDIYIRCLPNDYQMWQQKEFGISFLDNIKKDIEFYMDESESRLASR